MIKEQNKIDQNDRIESLSEINLVIKLFSLQQSLHEKERDVLQERKESISKDLNLNISI